MNHLKLRWAGFCLTLLPVLALTQRWLTTPELGRFQVVQQQHTRRAQPAGRSAVPTFMTSRLDSADQQEVHSATLAVVSDGENAKQLKAFWYGGSREGASDVRLFTASCRLAANGDTAARQPKWDARPILSRSDVQRQLHRHIRRIGNPVAYAASDGRLWLFFVTTSLGGWSTSAVNLMISEDNGLTFGPIRRLTTSPFFNISTLVRNPPTPLEGGGIVLPIYHECFGKFAELLWLDATGRIRHKQRLTWGRSSFQPALVAKNERVASVFMRVEQPGEPIVATHTQDGGRSFSPPKRIGLPNPNAAIDAAMLPDGRWLMIYNHHHKYRSDLSCALAPAPQGPWKRWLQLEPWASNQHSGSYAYPVIRTLHGGHFHLLYTVDRNTIKHVSFNECWLRQHGPESREKVLLTDD